VDDGTDNDVYFILTDHLGSTSVTLNNDGTVKSEMRYTAFGEVRHSSGSAPTDMGDRPIAPTSLSE